MDLLLQPVHSNSLELFVLHFLQVLSQVWACKEVNRSVNELPWVNAQRQARLKRPRTIRPVLRASAHCEWRMVNGERNKTEREDARKCKKTTDKGGRSASRTHQIHTTTG